jgi:predicted DNA-binding transcriptional regulator AlpA
LPVVNYGLSVAKVDPKDLIDAQVIADMLGLSTRRAISTYRTRHGDFPKPVVDMGAGRCLLWLRQDVESWRAKHPGRER